MQRKLLVGWAFFISFLAEFRLLPLPLLFLNKVFAPSPSLLLSFSFLQVRGDILFTEYWKKPEASRKSFRGGWFCTGDIAEFNAEKDSYKILGRASVDIIKCGGFKVSALDIEREILEHGEVEEAVVVGVEDGIQGEKICVLLRLKEGVESEADAFGEGGLRGWMKEFTAPYKLPGAVKVLEEIPKNTMGKYAKMELKKFFQSSSSS